MTSIDPNKLPDYLKAQRWFGGKAWPIKSVSLLDQATLPGAEGAVLAVVEVTYALGTPEWYLLALASDENGFRDALADDAFAQSLFQLIRGGKSAPSGSGVLRGEQLESSGASLEQLGDGPRIRRLGADQSNTSIVFDERTILKIIRKLEPGLNPEYEMGRFLSRRSFAAAPALLGALHLEGQAAATLALLHEFVPNTGTGWTYMLESFRSSRETSPQVLANLVQLGERVGELHATLASDPDDPAFAPEPIQLEDLQRWSSSIIGELGVTLADASELFPQALQQREEVVRRARRLAKLHPSGKKIRIHGDLHLGQVLRAEAGWVLFDFEGEPGRRFAQRREKQSPLKDVAGMMRSFAYAAATVELEGRPVGQQLRACRESFLEGYLRATRFTGLLPEDPEDFKGLLDAFELEKLLYEVRYELHNRPEWVRIPMEALMHPEAST